MQIQGQPPSLLNPPRGCRFHPRCPRFNRCKQDSGGLVASGGRGDHWDRCFLDDETRDREATKLLSGTMAEASQ